MKRLAVIAATVTALTALVSGGASAATSEPTSDQVKHAIDVMLRYPDVPTGLVVSKGWEFTAEHGTILKLNLCEIGNKAYDGAVAPVMYQSELGEIATANPTGLQQNIWQYGSRAQAKKAWRTLQNRLAKCTGTYTVDDGTNTVVQHLSNGPLKQIVKGRHGRFLYVNVDVNDPLIDVVDGAYYTYFLVGTAIQSMEYDNSETLDVTKAERRLVNKVSLKLANRWLGLP